MDLINLLGIIAGGCTTFAFLPQLIKIIKEKETKDISLGMYVIFTIGLILWLIYGFIINSLPIILANIFSLIFASIILFLKLKYK